MQVQQCATARSRAAFIGRRSSAALFALALAGTSAQAQDIGALLEVLKEKGVLTQDEYDRVMSRQQTKRESDREEIKFRAAEAAKEEVKAAKEEIKAATKDDVKAGFRDGFTFESADKRHALSLRGRVELDYRQFGGDDGANANTFDLRRAYFSMEGKVYDQFEYRVRGNLSTLNGPSSTVCTAVGPTSATDPTPRCTATAGNIPSTSNTNLDEAWLNVNLNKAAQVKFGQFKMPYSLEQLQTDLYTDFMERSMGDAVSPGKERGLQLWGYPKDGLFYALALSNGQGVNANETNNSVDNQDKLARFSVNFPELAGNRNFVAHLGASYSDGTLPVAAALTGRTEGRGVNFFQPDAFTGNDVERRRLGADAALAFGPVKLQAEWMQANYAGRSAASTTAVATDFDKDVNAYYASLTWMVTGERYADFYRSGLFARPRPLNNFKLGGSGRGAWEIGVRYSKFDASDFATTSPALVGSGVKSANSANEANAMTFGIKWLPNPNVRLMLNYVQTEFDTTVRVTNTGRPGSPAAELDKERAVTVRTQVDF